jgi:hypothetical protein
MSEQLTPDIIDTLVCELGRRPKDAPTIGQIIGAVTGLQRETDSLTVTFDPRTAEMVSAVVRAERQCCPTIGWSLETEPELRLQITGSPLQLDTLEAMFKEMSES